MPDLFGTCENEPQGANPQELDIGMRNPHSDEARGCSEESRVGSQTHALIQSGRLV